MLSGIRSSACCFAPSAEIAGSLPTRTHNAGTIARFGRWLCSGVSTVVNRIKGHLGYGAAAGPHGPAVRPGDSGLNFYEKPGTPLFGTRPRQCTSMAEFIDCYIHPAGKHMDGSPLSKDEAQSDAECIAMCDQTCDPAGGLPAFPRLKFNSWYKRLMGFLSFSYGLSSYGATAGPVVPVPAQHSAGHTLWLSAANRLILCPRPGEPYYQRAYHNVFCPPLLKMMSPDDQPESHSQTGRVIEYFDHISIDGNRRTVRLEKPIPAPEISSELSLFITTDQLTTTLIESCQIKDLSSGNTGVIYNKRAAEQYVNLSGKMIHALPDEKKEQMRGNATALFKTHVKMFGEFGYSPECYLSIPQDREGLIHYQADLMIRGLQQPTKVLFTLDVIPFDVLMFTNYSGPGPYELNQKFFLTSKEYQFAESTYTLQDYSQIIGKSFSVEAGSVNRYFKGHYDRYAISRCDCEGAGPETLTGKIKVTFLPRQGLKAPTCNFWLPRQIKSIKCVLTIAPDENNPKGRKIGFTHRYTLLRPDGSDVADEPEIFENKPEPENKGKARGLPSKKVSNLMVARSQMAAQRKVHALIKDEL